MVTLLPETGECQACTNRGGVCSIRFGDGYGFKVRLCSDCHTELARRVTLKQVAASIAAEFHEARV
jgi:hypothetical protein